jgi:geranylgeranyl diphosphate synthase type I
MSVISVNETEAVRLDPLQHVQEYCHRINAEHGFGPLAQHVRFQLNSGGKRIRARITISACEAMGATWDDSVPFAAACELLHNASLVHDDLQDGDTIRRGRPALWATAGLAQAVTAGDLLLMLPMLCLDDERYSPALRWYLTQSLCYRAARTACGQSDELTLLSLPELPNRSDYVRAAIGKTGHFFALPIEGAALIAGRSSTVARAIGDAVLPMGLLYQVVDDIIDLYGDKGRGISGNDLREGKFSALVALHVERYPTQANKAFRILKTPRSQTSESDVNSLIDTMRKNGTLQAAISWAWELADNLRTHTQLGTLPALRSVVLRIVDQIIAPLERIDISVPTNGVDNDQ